MSAVDSTRAQYESFPYPMRDPADERHRLLKTFLDGLPCINHHVFGGAFDFSAPLRILVAGGGTGDSLIYLAQQVHDLRIAAEVTYLDLSAASRVIAEERARVRGLEGIRFKTGSLLEVETLVEGEFDYINCSGVLHHLEDPLLGLKALQRKLHRRGGMGLMLYAALGRTGVYPMQAMLRTLAPESMPSSERVRIARRLIGSLPDTNWLLRNPAIAKQEWEGDSDLFDLLLNSTDKAYSVEEVAGLAHQAGLRIASFMPPALYEPATYLKDPEILERIAGLQGVARASFAEQLVGCLNKQVFFAVRADNPLLPPDPGDRMFIPVLEAFPPIPGAGREQVRLQVNGPYFNGVAALTADSAAILRLVDGRRTLEEIRTILEMSGAAFDAEVKSFYRWMHEFTYLHLSRSAWAR